MALAKTFRAAFAGGFIATALCSGCRTASPRPADMRAAADSPSSPASSGSSAVADAGASVVPASHTVPLPSQLAVAAPGRFAGRAATAPIVAELAGPHRVDDYILFALRQNADVQSARQRVAAMANRVPQAASLQDPMLAVNSYPAPIQTASGALLAQVSATQQVPWFGKLRTRAAAAEAETNVARAELAAAELRVVADVKRAYYELYILQQSIDITLHQRTLLVDISKIAAVKYEALLVNQQDVLRSQVEISKLDNDLIALRQQLQSGQARLARLLHVSPETGLRALDRLPPEELPKDVERLYETAIRIRPELQSQLAAIQRDRQQIDLARLNYFPDLTAGAGWIDIANHGVALTKNGRDAAFVSMMVNVPIYRKRLDAAVREAEAATAADSRKYDSLRDRTQEEVKDLFVRIEADQQMLELFRESIVPQADQTLQVSIQGYESGNVDFLQMLSNWQELLRYQILAYRLEGQLRQDLAELERIVGGSLPAVGAPSGEGLPVPPGERDR